MSLLKETVGGYKFSRQKTKLIESLRQQFGRDGVQQIIEAYEVGPHDYEKWLDVITGYANDHGMSLKSRTTFVDLAHAVLDNDPAPIDMELQDSIVKTLWALHKSEIQKLKVTQATQKSIEDEQLSDALTKIREPVHSEQIPLSWRLRQARNAPPHNNNFKLSNDSWHDEDDLAIRQLRRKARGSYPVSFHDEEYASETNSSIPLSWRLRQARNTPPHNNDFKLSNDSWHDEDDLAIRQLRRKRKHYQDEESSYFDDYDDSNDNRLDDFKKHEELDDGYDEDDDLLARAREMRHARDLEDFDPVQKEEWKSLPKTYFSGKEEEEDSFASPFSKGQVVKCKKSGQQYTVEIPDMRGDKVGIMDNGRIRMVSARDITPETQEEETVVKSNQLSLHDVLTGQHSREHLSHVQKQIEKDGANAWMKHHAAFANNPHPKGSMAHTAWEKGVKAAAKSVWAPPVVIDKREKKKKR